MNSNSNNDMSDFYKEQLAFYDEYFERILTRLDNLEKKIDLMKGE